MTPATQQDELDELLEEMALNIDHKDCANDECLGRWAYHKARTNLDLLIDRTVAERVLAEIEQMFAGAAPDKHGRVILNKHYLERRRAELRAAVRKEGKQST